METNPMLQDDFAFCSMDCKPLVGKVAKAAGMPDIYRGSSSYGEGGPAAYTMGFDTSAGEEVFVFSRTTMTEQLSANRMLTWGGVSTEASLCIVAERFSAEFMNSLTERWPKPVYFAKAIADEPFFVKATLDDTVPVADDCCLRCHLLLDMHFREEPCDDAQYAGKKPLLERLWTGTGEEEDE
jgi:hypothetical protein